MLLDAHLQQISFLSNQCCVSIVIVLFTMFVALVYLNDFLWHYGSVFRTAMIDSHDQCELTRLPQCLCVMMFLFTGEPMNWHASLLCFFERGWVSMGRNICLRLSTLDSVVQILVKLVIVCFPFSVTFKQCLFCVYFSFQRHKNKTFLHYQFFSHIVYGQFIGNRMTLQWQFLSL